MQKESENGKQNEDKSVADEDKKQVAPGGNQKPKRKISENKILARRGLQNRTGSLTLNVKERGSHSNDYASSPITPSIRVIDHLKFAPIEVQPCSGLTPQIQQPNTALDVNTNEAGHLPSRKMLGPNLSPFFPTNLPMGDSSRLQPSNPMSSVTPGPSSSKAPENSDVCICHLTKARLLWNTTFQASVFYLAKSWPSIVSSILCSQSISQQLDFINCNKLDIFTENILLNPYTVLLEVFTKTLMNKFIESKVSRNPILLPTLHRLNPIDQSQFTGKTFNGLLPWLTMHRFVRSLVRQLSLTLSKSPMPDGNLKMKIGRHANKNHLKREARMKDHLR